MRHARMLSEGIPGSRLVVVEGAGHGMIWAHRRELERVVDALLGDPEVPLDPAEGGRPDAGASS